MLYGFQCFIASLGSGSQTKVFNSKQDTSWSFLCVLLPLMMMIEMETTFVGFSENHVIGKDLILENVEKNCDQM